MLEERGIEHAAGSQVWLRRTLEEIVSQVRRLLDVTGVSFLVVDPGHAPLRSYRILGGEVTEEEVEIVEEG